jgi:hypothetical protein
VKNIQISSIVIVLIITLTTITSVYAKDKKESTVLASYKKDITGDHQQDIIKINGIATGQKLKNLEINITTSSNKKYNIPLTGNQKPTVYFKDLNQDGLKDLFVSSTPPKENATDSRLFSFKDDQFTNIGFPEPLSLTAQFENNYQASIMIDKTGKKYSIDLKNKRKNFERSGLYQNGRLNEPTELMVHSIEHINPVRLRDMKFGIKASQSISDSYTETAIANVVSTWKWSNGRWELLKTVVKKVAKD